VTGSRDFVVFGSQPFGARVPLGDWQIARRLGQEHRVLWIDPPASPLAAQRRFAPQPMIEPRLSAEGVLVACPLVPSGRTARSTAAMVDRLVSAQVNRWVRRRGMSDVDVIAFTPRHGQLRGVRRSRLIAWLKDRDWAASGVLTPAWLRERQAELIRHADVVTAVSPTLVEDCRDLGVDATLIPNGCDESLFALPRPEPPALRHLPRPRVMFAGAWDARVDTELVRTLACALPHASIVLVGAVVEPVPRCANVHAVGPVPFTELPAYLQAGDVGIVPYRRSVFNDASCPLKVYDYLAAGLPAVITAGHTTDLPDDLVRRRTDAGAFVAAVAELAGRDVSDACRGLAATNTWEQRSAALLERLGVSSASSARGSMWP
jgi:teichuronic acid biosynthesis glycosyltransferase TuaH